MSWIFLFPKLFSQFCEHSNWLVKFDSRKMQAGNVWIHEWEASISKSCTVAVNETQLHQHISSEGSGTFVISNSWIKASPGRRKIISVKTTHALRMKEEDKNTEEAAGSNDSNWVSKELGMEEDDEEGELLWWALNIFRAFWQQRDSKFV